MQFSFPHGTLYNGDAVTVLSALPAESVQCCITSPPYWGLRDYGVAGQMGLEDTPEEYIERLAAVFAEVYRVLKNDGTLWVTIGDSYSYSSSKKNWQPRGKQASNTASLHVGLKRDWNLPPKNLIGLPWRLAFALQKQGWILRQDIIWHKSNAMPESCKDRPTRAHEYVFLFSKSRKYFYGYEAISEFVVTTNAAMLTFGRASNEPDRPGQGRKQHRPERGAPASIERRNKRSVWEMPVAHYSGAHFATFPPALAKTCIEAGSRYGDTVLDPFMGSGTTGMVARQTGRKWLGVELNPEYCQLALKRIDVNTLKLTELAE